MRKGFALTKGNNTAGNGEGHITMASDSESASPSRRSTRKRAHVNYNDNAIKIEEHAEPETRKRRVPCKIPTAKHPRRNKENDEDGVPSDNSSGEKVESTVEDTSDRDEEGGSADEPPVKKRKAAKKGKAPKKGRGHESERTCEYCDEVCVSKTGLKNHVDNFVCRPELKPQKTAGKRFRKRSSTRAGDKSSNEDGVPSDHSSGDETESAGENASDRDEEEESDDEPPVKKRKATKKGRGPESKRTCAYCDKVCVSKFGLKYHVDKFVCRPELRQQQTAGKQSRKRSSTGAGDMSSKVRGRKTRHRGSIAALTCSNCKQVFTSTLGLKYHVDHKVCVGHKKSETMPFPPLIPGTKYVTQFGVVEIVADNRAIPALCDTSKKASKSYPSSRQKKSYTQVWQSLAIKTRVRRERLFRLYENNRINQKAVWQAYGVDPMKYAVDKKKPAASQDGPDQLDKSYPDRIVECVLIPDERTFIKDGVDSDDDDKDDLMQVSSSEVKQPGPSPFCTKLFLRRSVIEAKYIPSAPVYVCDDCGQKFSSQAGYSYHFRSHVCIMKDKGRAAAARQQLKAIESKLAKALNRIDRPDKKAKRDVAVYPQVWLSLGFKFLPKSLAKREEAVQKVREEKNLKPPDELLHRLRTELRRDRDRMLGAIYPGVFESLGFRRPPPSWKIQQEQEKVAKRKSRQEQRRLKKERERQKRPPPPIIDIRVLAGEADSGRYPSMKRYSGEHHDVCCICKKGGTLLCCDFCPKTVHIECIRTKHTIKDPEPQDDFMCHLCIRYIMARRNRAEKRRIMKQKAALRRNGQDATTSSVVPGAELEFESDYHAVAAFGHELRDISELLSDAKARLRRAIGIAKMNETRRSLLGP